MHIATSSFASLILKYSTVHKPGPNPGPSPARPEPSPRAGIFISTSLSPQSRAQARAFRPSRARTTLAAKEMNEAVTRKPFRVLEKKGCSHKLQL